MPSSELFVAFLVTAAIFAFIPGPSMLYAAARTLAGGRWSGLMATLGIHIGCYAHIVAAATGLTFLFHAVPVVYMAVKLAGAAYLISLGISLFRARTKLDDDVPVLAAKPARRAFIESVLVEVLNPKTAIFFMAFLPQFIDASAGAPVWLQFAVLGVIVNSMFSFADIIGVVLAGALKDRLKSSSRVQRLTQRAGGAILVSLGVHLALRRS